MKTCLFLCSLGPLFSSGMSLKEAVNKASEYGINAVEPYPVAEFSQIDLREAYEFGEYCAKKGISIPCFSMMARFENDNYKDEIKRLKGYIEMTAQMGAELFHHTLVPSLGHMAVDKPLLSNILPRLKDVCTELCEYAQKYSITCIYEDQGFVVNGVKDFEKFYTAIDVSNKGVCADFGNILFVGEDTQTFVGHFAPYVKHVHTKDYLLKKGSSQFPGQGWYLCSNGDFLRGTVIGHGTVDFVQSFKTLIRSGYEGYYSIEYDGLENFDDGIKKGMENLLYYYDEAKRQLDVKQKTI